MSNPPGAIFLLEDNPARLAEMLDVLREVFPDHVVHVEDDSNSAIRWLTENQPRVDLISFDHDLDSVPRNESQPTDHGCGRDVVNFLATCSPTCPVIIHTSNAMAGDGMFYELKYSKWPVVRVYPHDHHDWVKSDWKSALLQLIQQSWL
jgi:CheY-like chemotaxis protein